MAVLVAAVATSGLASIPALQFNTGNMYSWGFEMWLYAAILLTGALTYALGYLGYYYTRIAPIADGIIFTSSRFFFLLVMGIGLIVGVADPNVKTLHFHHWFMFLVIAVLAPPLTKIHVLVYAISVGVMIQVSIYYII